jgi:hypothetical protein
MMSTTSRSVTLSPVTLPTICQGVQIVYLRELTITKHIVPSRHAISLDNVDLVQVPPTLDMSTLALSPALSSFPSWPPLVSLPSLGPLGSCQVKNRRLFEGSSSRNTKKVYSIQFPTTTAHEDLPSSVVKESLQSIGPYLARSLEARREVPLTEGAELLSRHHRLAGSVNAVHHLSQGSRWHEMLSRVTPYLRHASCRGASGLRSKTSEALPTFCTVFGESR